jgi:hypothetical protein
VGISVGVRVGKRVGSFVGILEGMTLGKRVGMVVGDLEGAVVVDGPAPHATPSMPAIRRRRSITTRVPAVPPPCAGPGLRPIMAYAKSPVRTGACE